MQPALELELVDNSTPAESLVGYKLMEGQWLVKKRIRYDDGISGGTTSACYLAEAEDGSFAFVKAFDFKTEELLGDTDHLEKMLREFNYEKRVHFFCNTKGINRVTKIYGADKVIVRDEVVHFIVCEWIDKSLRENQPPGDQEVPLYKRFLALRDIASALSQLHTVGIAHQDVKPSNAMCAPSELLKLTDLGSSSCQDIEAPPHDSDALVGQANYAPYELLYDYPHSTWIKRRCGCDLFLLGNLCFTSLVGGSLSLLVCHSLRPEHRPLAFTGQYSEVLPQIMDEQNFLIDAIIPERVPKEIANDVIKIIKSLCHPDPEKRGHEINIQRKNQYSLERYISAFDLLAIKARHLTKNG